MKLFISLAAALGFVSVDATSSLRRSTHERHEAVLEAQEHLNTHACTAGDCKTTHDIVTVFEAEWKKLKTAYKLTGFKPTFQAGTAITLYGCRASDSPLSDFDMWERNIQSLAPATDLEAIAGAQATPHTVPLDVRKNDAGKVLGFEILKANVGQIKDKAGTAVTGIAHEYDIWDGHGPGGEYKTLTHKTELKTKNGVEFSVISCADLKAQKQKLADMSPAERAHGLTGGETLGNQKLTQDKADVACIAGLMAHGKNGPCDPTWLQGKIIDGAYTGWPKGTDTPIAESGASGQSIGHKALHALTGF